MLCTYVIPVFIKVVEFIGILIFTQGFIIESRKFNLKILLLAFQGNFSGIVERFFKNEMIFL